MEATQVAQSADADVRELPYNPLFWSDDQVAQVSPLVGRTIKAAKRRYWHEMSGWNYGDAQIPDSDSAYPHLVGLVANTNPWVPNHILIHDGAQVVFCGTIAHSVNGRGVTLAG